VLHGRCRSQRYEPQTDSSSTPTAAMPLLQPPWSSRMQQRPQTPRRCACCFRTGGSFRFRWLLGGAASQSGLLLACQVRLLSGFTMRAPYIMLVAVWPCACHHEVLYSVWLWMLCCLIRVGLHWHVRRGHCLCMLCMVMLVALPCAFTHL
jgi:hypothetical protein